MGLSPKEFSTIYGSQSGRSGAASFGGCKWWCAYGAMGTPRGLEIREVPKELYEDGPGGDPLRLPGCHDACPSSSFRGPYACPTGPSSGHHRSSSSYSRNPEEAPSRVVQYVGSRCPAILGGSFSRLYFHLLYRTWGAGGGAMPPRKKWGVRGAEPHMFF